MSFVSALAHLGGGQVSLSYNSHRGGTLARLLLSNPTRKNALSGKMMVELSQAVEELESRHDVSVVKVVGDGDFFCAGADLGVAKDIDGEKMCALMQDTTTRLRDLPAVSISIIAGGA